MMLLLTAVLLAAAVLTWPKRMSPADRLATLIPSELIPSETRLRKPYRDLGSDDEPSGPTTTTDDSRAAMRRQALIAGSVALMGYLVIGDVPGMVTGALLAILAVAMVRRRETPESRRRHARMAADLPFAVDLLVACLRAGQPVGAALDAAANAVGGPLGQRLTWVGSQIRLGAAPQEAWATLAAEPSLAALSRTMTRAELSGAPVADVLVRLADDAKQEARAAASAAARRVGVQAVAPLGLCFLPAFVLLGIIPVVAGLTAQIVLP